MPVGIAGIDETPRIKAAHVGVAGEVKDQTKASAFGIAGINEPTVINAARFGVSGIDRPGKIDLATQAGVVGVAGPNTRKIVGAANGSMGIAGNVGQKTGQLVDLPDFKDRDKGLADLTRDSNRLGDRAARNGWQRGVWFASYEYIVSPFTRESYGQIAWRKGREHIFAPGYRTIPLHLDSSGYRREITVTAPKWAMEFDNYMATIELVQPDGYAAWDYPFDKMKSLAALWEMMTLFPGDVTNGRLWPVFSIRWTWKEDAHLDYAKLPGWRSDSLADLIPLNRTQRRFKRETREKMARLAISNALVMAQDADFRWMCETFGQVMIGGMVGCGCSRMARHLFAATLCHIFPHVHFWLLGQANFAVVNGLGMHGLLDRVSTDGSWWINDSVAERFAIVEDGLITMLHINPRRDQPYRRETFFTTVEMMAANLRSLLAAYNGEWTWPPPEPLPLDLMDPDQAAEMKSRLTHTQLELFGGE